MSSAAEKLEEAFESPPVNISLKGIVGSGKDGSELAMATQIPGNLSRRETNKILDNIMYCVQRQRIIGEIPFYKEQIAYCKKSIDNTAEQIRMSDEAAEAGWKNSDKQGKVKLKEAQAQKRKQLMVNIAGWQADLEGYKKSLIEAEALVAEAQGEVEQGEADKSA